VIKCNPKHDPFELNDAQIKQLIKMTHFNSRDVFYDLGCGSGKVVIQVDRRTDAKRAIGIDNEECQFIKTWSNAFKVLRKRELWFIEFLLKSFQDHDYSDATVIYYSLHESKDAVSMFQRKLGRKEVKLITKDLPFIGYKSANANRANRDCWLFLTKYPFE
jgi:hypothetical protein